MELVIFGPSVLGRTSDRDWPPIAINRVALLNEAASSMNAARIDMIECSYKPKNDLEMRPACSNDVFL